MASISWTASQCQRNSLRASTYRALKKVCFILENRVLWVGILYGNAKVRNLSMGYWESTTDNGAKILCWNSI